MKGRRAVAVTLLASLVLAMSRTSAAPDDDKVKCATGYEQAQRTRKEGALLASRKHLLVCTQEVCPAVLRTDCIKWLAEVDAAFPSVVLVARAPDGTDLFDVKVSLDGKAFLGKLDGKAYEVEPGAHTFRFEREGNAPVEQQVMIHEGEKRRTISVVIGTPSSTSKGPSTPEGPPTSDVSRPIPASVFVLGGLGLVGIGGFVLFGTSGNTKMRELEACKPKCDPSRVDEAKRTYLIGDVSLVVGIAALSVAGVLFFTRPESTPTTAAKLTPLVGPIQNGFAAGLSGEF
jgi:hypothetical protein